MSINKITAEHSQSTLYTTKIFNIICWSNFLLENDYDILGAKTGLVTFSGVCRASHMSTTNDFTVSAALSFTCSITVGFSSRSDGRVFGAESPPNLESDSVLLRDYV